MVAESEFEVLQEDQPNDKLLYEVDRSKCVVITDAMREYSSNRTANHIQRVVEFGEKLGFDFSEHDHTKFSAELIEQYILIDNFYRDELDPLIEYTMDMTEASFKHVKLEPHHPEYWDDTVIMNYDGGIDVPTVASIVDCSGMTVPAICEMVCDWCAMSQELGGHPSEWAENHIGIRWKFTEEQEELIFLIIEMIWTPGDVLDVEVEVVEASEKRHVFKVDSTKEEFEGSVIDSLAHKLRSCTESISELSSRM